VIFLRDEEREELIVRTCVGIDSDAVRVGNPLRVPDRLKHLLLRMRDLRQIGNIEAGIEGIGFPILVVPLKIKGERIGLLITGKQNSSRVMFDEIRRRLFQLIATFASLVIENAKVYDYLRQQFAQHSHDLILANRGTAGAGDEAQQLMISSLKNPNKVVRLLALSFYKELSRAGFGPGHIATAAAEMLDCISRQEFTESSLPESFRPERKNTPE